MSELEHQRGFPATGFCDRQEMAPQQPRWKHDLNAVTLVLRLANPAPFASGLESHGSGQRKVSAGGGAFDEWNVIGSLRQVPQACQLADIQQRASA
jgi:hypothetical protein